MKVARRFILGFFALILGFAGSYAAPPDDTWFLGVSFFGFELNGSGTMNTIQSRDTEFDVRRYLAYGLVTNNIQTSETSLGLGWNDNQLPGLELQAGFRHNWRFTTRFDFFWAFPKRADQYASPDPNGLLSLTKQSTTFNQSHVRVMLDWTPFEPLQLWYFTAGIEYTEFLARLEFHFDRYANDEPQERLYEEYNDGGSTFGVVLGSGLILPGGSQNGQSYVQFSWSYSPFNKDWFAWDSKINMGGMGLELGYRWYLPGKK